jgi:hypothetical protein
MLAILTIQDQNYADRVPRQSPTAHHALQQRAETSAPTAMPDTTSTITLSVSSALLDAPLAKAAQNAIPASQIMLSPVVSATPYPVQT